VRVVIAEDLALLRDGLARLLRAHDFEVVAEVGDPVALAQAMEEHQPVDVVIMDVRMPPTFTNEGLVAAIEARAKRPGQPVLVLSQYVEQLYARELMQDSTEGVGYLLKDRVSDVLAFVDAVRRVAAGGTVLDPKVVEVLLSQHDRRGSAGPMGRLTAREREVIGLMAEGRSNAAIAGAMFITGKAVDKHINSIFMKLDLPLDADDNRRVLAVLRYLQDMTGERPKKGADLA
jgi:DNA-binding NarL/FixJ family response regulator